jgi:hypothetical protein
MCSEVITGTPNSHPFVFSSHTRARVPPVLSKMKTRELRIEDETTCCKYSYCYSLHFFLAHCIPTSLDEE